MDPKKQIPRRGRMPRNKKETSRKQLQPKKSKPNHHDDSDDDDSIDSYGNIKDLIDYDYDSDDNSSIEKRPTRKAAIKANKKINKIIKNDESESDDEDYEEGEIDEDDEDEEDYEDEDDDEEDYEDEDEDMDNDNKMPGISISFGGFSGGSSKKIPKRHDLKKESVEVNKFVKLLTTQEKSNTIDDQIDMFKNLDSSKQHQVIEALEHRPNNSEESLMFKILTMNLPRDTQTLVLNKYNTLQNMDPSVGEYYKLRSWLEKLVSLPIGIYKQIPAKIEDGPEVCSNFMMRAQQCLADSVFGQEEAKLQILQFIATKLANPESRGLSLLLYGEPGVGKTSIIKNGIAKALDWPFQFISLGGASDATTYTGHQLVYEGSHCGKIVNSLAAAKSMSMVLMFDELDKISQTPKGEEVQNLLIHLTDPVQNADFEDKYLSGIPIDLSKVMFIFSGNDITKIDKVLLDRMVVIKLKGYKIQDKVTIAENFLIPNALKEVNLQEKVLFNRELITHILENYAKEEPGVREFKRCLEQIIQKINMLRIFNSKDMPFHIPNFALPFILTKEHIPLFLKKKEEDDTSFQRMYV